MTATPAERDQLRKIIQQWNENRLDLFALSEPSEDLEFHGVMRFYFQESGQKVATKCIRVSSTATTRAVIEALIEKFHPDLKMLTTPDYSLWEVHESGEDRKLMAEEKPLLVQLNWHKDDREGRFLLKREGADLYLPLSALQLNDTGMQRKYSKREKKELKRAQKEAVAKQRQEQNIPPRAMEAEDVATKLYSEVPPTTFTRTISNPEIVMKKRRERKLEQRLREMGEGGSLKVYGTELSPSKPYVTLLVSSRDRTDKLLKEALDKYGLDRHDPAEYCLIEVTLPANENASIAGSLEHVAPISERVLDEDEIPLLNLAQRSNQKANVVFHVRRRTGTMPRNRRKRMAGSTSDYSMEQDQMGTAIGPILVELNPDGSEIQGEPKVHSIEQNVTEIGSDRALTQGGVQSLPLFGPYVHPRHCVLAFMDGIVTLTPCTPTAEIQVNGQGISETTILRNGSLIRIGRSNVFRFMERALDGVSMAGSLPRSVSMPNRRQRRSTDGASQKSSQETTFGVEPDVNENEEGIRMVAVELETTFDIDGDITTFAVGPHSCEPVPPSPMPSMGPIIRSPFVGKDSIPAIIELLDNAEDKFLSVVVRDAQADDLSFKLSPVYVLYMCCRYRVSPHYRTSLMPEERALKLADFLTKAVNLLHVTIQDHCHESGALAFWMANCSELLYFIKMDRDLGSATIPEPQESMADAVEKAFGHLTSCLRQDLHSAMPAMLDPNLDDANSTSPCLHMLTGAMTLLRHCRVNAALTIQLFSQLFHYVNMYLFNWLVSREGATYCCRSWGVRLNQRLSRIQTWALKQGLELAAECHLDRIVQTVKLLETPKTVEFLATLGSTCYKLNSVQVRNLLERYKPESGEAPMSRDLIESVCKLAENQADEMVRSDGRSVQVEEEIDLQLPFLLPEDAYSPDVVKGIPVGLQQFLDFLMQQGVCRMIPQPSSSGNWSVHFNTANQMMPSLEQMNEQTALEANGQPEIVQITFPKSDGGIGLSIVAAQGVGQPTVGIYVKKVVPGSAAERDGRLQSGDQLLAVNGLSLMGITQEEAAKRMAQSGSTVSFEVAKQAALYNGLATALYQQSPQVPRYHPARSEQSLNGAQQRQYIMNGPSNLVGHQRFASTSGLVRPHQNTLPPTVNYQTGPAHARSLSTSNLRHEVIQQQAHAPGVQHSLGSLPRANVPERQYHNLGQYHSDRQPQRQSPAPYSPIHPQQQQQHRPPLYQNQPPLSARSYHEQSSVPMDHNVRRSGEFGQVPINGINYSPMQQQLVRRPPSVDETRVYRAPSVTSDPRSPPVSLPAGAFRYPAVPSAVPDYQNLPLVTPTPVQVQSPNRPARPSSQQYNNQFVSQEPYVSSPQYQPSVSSEVQSPRALISPRQLADSARTNSWQRDDDMEKQVENEMVRFIQEQATLLEQKEFLTDAEERRYKALKYEIAYRQRLLEEEESPQQLPNSRIGGERTVSDEMTFMSDIASSQLPDYNGRSSSNEYMNREQPPNRIPHTNGHSQHQPAFEAQLQSRLNQRQDSITETPEQRQFRRDEYYVNAEGRLREEVQRSKQQSPPQDANQMINLQTQVYHMAVTENRQPPPLAPPIAKKPAPPQVPPKLRKVQFVEDPLPSPPPPIEEEIVVHEPIQPVNGFVTQMAPELMPEHRYVYDTSETEAPRTQVLGRQEVYRDPRDQRLHKINEQQTQKQPRVDGSHLAFRDKMKLFAQQIGEATPKDKMKVSSAQRDIEDQIDTSS